MQNSRFARAAWLLLLLSLPASAKELWESEWIEVRTPHFVIASAQDPEKTAGLARELEDFRRMVEIFTNIGRFEERIPTKIIMLPRLERDLGFDGKKAGYFQTGMRANYAARGRFVSEAPGTQLKLEVESAGGERRELTLTLAELV